jgi:hypothetical protein
MLAKKDERTILSTRVLLKLSDRKDLKSRNAKTIKAIRKCMETAESSLTPKEG